MTMTAPGSHCSPGVLSLRSAAFVFAAFVAGMAAVSAQQPASPPVLLPGQAVEVFVRDGKWYPARIVEITVDGRPRVRYDGYGADSDEVVDPRTLRLRKEEPSPGATPAPGAAPTPAETKKLPFAPGQRVEVFAKNKWFKATVLQAFENQVEVQYDGYAKKEWVTTNPKWIRAESAAETPPQTATPPPETLPPAPAPGAVPVAPAIPPAPAPSIGSAITNPTGQLPPEGLYLMERDLAGVKEMRVVLIDKAGMVFENPAGGLDPFDSETFRAANPSRVGKARMGRGEMEIVWEGGRLPAASAFESTPEGFKWDMAVFRRLAPVSAGGLAGSYQAGRTEPVRTSDGWTMGGTGMRLDLNSDGTYRRTNADGIVIGEGSYTMSGHTLTLENNGVKTRHCAARYTTADGAETGLYFDGQFLRALP